MGAMRNIFKPVVAFVAIGLLAPAAAQQDGAGQPEDPPDALGPGGGERVDRLDTLYEALRTASSDAADEIEAKIREEWSRSGSPSMDLLLARGREAMEADDPRAAIRQFSALIDHAPDFAEGYHMRATAYYRMDRYGPALDDLRRTLELNPKHFAALTGVGLILEDIGAVDGALDAFRAAHALHPNQAEVAQSIEALAREVEGERL